MAQDRAERSDTSLVPGGTPVTPVFVLTGFLGSGKTTLLAHMIRQPELADTAVIVNEFGEIGLDHLLLAHGEEDDVVLLDSGCLCCAVNSSLTETLSDLFHRRERQAVPPFRRVIIETSGLADPAPILHSVMADRFTASRYTLGGVITCADGLLFQVEAAAHPEAVRQVAMADRVIVTKVDLADAATIAAVVRDIQAYNPSVEVLRSAPGAIDAQRLLAPAQHAGAKAPVCDMSHEQSDHSVAEHSAGIVSVSVPVAHAVDWPAYANWVFTLQRDFGDRLLRVKGLLRFAGESEVRVIQGVRHLFAPPAEAERPLGAEPGIVFIALGVTAAEISRSVVLLKG